RSTPQPAYLPTCSFRFLSSLLHASLEPGHRQFPEPVHVRPHLRHSVRIESVDASGAVPLVHQESGSFMTFRCWDTAGRLTGTRAARSPTDDGRSDNSSKIARRVGSPSTPMACPLVSTNRKYPLTST